MVEVPAGVDVVVLPGLELTVDVELRNTRYELGVYEAIGAAANDAHGTLETMLTASDPEAARHALQQRYGFTEVQSLAVMDMQFRRLTATDREKIEQRRHELAQRVRFLEAELGGTDSQPQ